MNALSQKNLDIDDITDNEKTPDTSPEKGESDFPKALDVDTSNKNSPNLVSENLSGTSSEELNSEAEFVDTVDIEKESSVVKSTVDDMHINWKNLATCAKRRSVIADSLLQNGRDLAHRLNIKSIEEFVRNETMMSSTNDFIMKYVPLLVRDVEAVTRAYTKSVVETKDHWVRGLVQQLQGLIDA